MLASLFMRFHFVIVSAVLLVGCQSPNESRDTTTRIAESLARQITAEEARRIILDRFDPDIQAAQARSATDEDSRLELEVLTRGRRRKISGLESFLSRRQNGDELWTYRTYVTADRRGGESGFALVRNRRVVEHMGDITYD